MKNGTTVYHVAFPDVRAQVYGDHTDTEKWIMVLFDRPVMFKRTGRYDISWSCSRSLLFPSSSQAAAAHDPLWDLKDLKEFSYNPEAMREKVLRESNYPEYKVTAVNDAGGCQHEWVTWTGLHGTITDCTKCKAVKS